MSATLAVLTEHRDAILLAEIGALLHDLGKLSAEFIVQQSRECKQNKSAHPECGFDHEEIRKRADFLGPDFQNLLENPQWNRRLRIDVLDQLRQAPQYLAHYISGHRSAMFSSNMGLLALIVRCDQADSGVDKGATTDAGKQSLSGTWVASAFGFEAGTLSTDPAVLAMKRKELGQTLTDTLNRVLSTKKGEPANVRRMIFEGIEKNYRLALGDTRRAANDVTLWDHSYSVASLYKAALAKLLLEEKWTEPAKLQWRILRVAIDGLGFLGQTHQVADVLGRQEALRQALDAVRALLEVTYPLGNEVYRDENGSAFVAPDVAGLLDRPDEHGVPLRDRIRDAFTAELAGEVQLILEPEDFSQPSRGAIRLGELLRRPLPPLSADPQIVAAWWPQPPQEDVCTVCGLRPQGHGAEQIDEYRHNPRYYQQKAAARNVCCICLGRRGRRAAQWAADLGKPAATHTTIWTDEVADEHGRLALIVGQFDLEHWLDGRYLNSIFTQALATRDGHAPTPTIYDDLVAALADELCRNVGPDKGNPPWLQRLAPEAFRVPAQQFYQAVVEERDVDGLSAGVAADDWDAKAHLLALFLLRKHPSFARLRRIWETTRGFWQAVRDEDLPQTGPAGPRLRIQVQESPDLGHFHAYELNLGLAVLQVVWDPDQGCFLTAANLAYVARQLPDRPASPEDWRKLLTRQPFGLEEPTGYGGAKRSLDVVTITNVEPVGTYTPAIPILAEPRTFLALVPAHQAPAILQAIQDRYARELGKVRNRLPLTLGLVACPRRTPLRAVVEAGRRLLDQPTSTELWTVESQQNSDIQFTNGVRWQIPITLGDGSFDPYYPYFFVQAGDAGGQGRPRRFRSFRPTDDGPEPCWLVHATELQTSDVVYVTPSTFDFVYLDATARRFEVSYDPAGRNRHRPTRPYHLEDLATLGELWGWIGPGRLSPTQRHDLLGLIEAKREEWRQLTGITAYDPTFQQFVRDVLAHTDWRGARPDEDEEATLYQAALTGVLADVAELYDAALKTAT
ncbi:MAG: CRISPR-associated protein Csx11 [Chloroflexi bacterium]|nr:CRISPR-associated protein Csx11 [Chloroflexota bacterium]MBU1746205.1 CRISPR-associated protein Csx11 [Chloroflexota bacterium]